MLSLKYKNFIKKALYEMDEAKANELVDNSIDAKDKAEDLIDEKYSYWIIHKDQHDTDFYYIENNYLDKDVKELTFNGFKLYVTYNKTELIFKNLDPITVNVEGGDSKDTNKDKVTKYFGVPGVNSKSAESLIQGIASNVKIDTRLIKNYAGKKFLTLDDDSEEDKNKNIKNKEKYIKDFDSSDVPHAPEKKEENKENKVSDEVIIKNMKSKKGSSIMLDPSHLIGDEYARPLQEVKQIAEKKVLEFEKALSRTYSSDENYDKESNEASIEEVAAVIVYKALQTVLTAPCNPMSITKYDINHNKELEFDKNLPDFNENKNKNIKEAKSYEYKAKTKGSEILNIVSVNPPEVLTPLAFASMNIPESNWSIDSKGISSKKLVNYLFNRDGNNLSNAKVSYPLKRNQMLYDSIIWVPYGKSYRRINISTKGGKNGRGVSASLAGIFQYLLDEQYQTESIDDIKKLGEKICNSNSTTHDAIETNIKNFIDTYCSHIKDYENNGNFYITYYDSIVKIILFGCTNNYIHKELCSAYYGKSLDNLIKETNSDRNFSECVMRLLDYQKYDFAQVNCKPYLFGETFSYDYYVQYPAKFSGTVKLEKATTTVDKEEELDKKSYSYVKFHIMGG